MNEAIAKAVDEIARESRTRRHPRLPARRARDPRGGRDAAQAPPEGRRDPAALLAPVRRGAGPRLRAGLAPPHRARDQRGGDLAHRARHPLRDRHGARARQALQSPAEDRPAAHRADFAGGGASSARDAAGAWRAAWPSASTPRRISRPAPTSPRPRSCGPRSPRVILRMAALELGEIAAFPFLEPPTPRQIEDGYRSLFELGAIDDEARPHAARAASSRSCRVDPRIGRMLARRARVQLPVRDGDPRRGALDPGSARPAPGQARRNPTAPTRNSATSPPISCSSSTCGSSSTRPSATRSPTASSGDLPRAFPLVRAHARVARPRRAAARDGRGARRSARTRRTPPTSRCTARSSPGLISNVGLKAQEGDHYNAPRGIPVRHLAGFGPEEEPAALGDGGRAAGDDARLRPQRRARRARSGSRRRRRTSSRARTPSRTGTGRAAR